MLVLTRKPGEKLHIGNDIVLTIVEVHGSRVRVSIDAPPEVRILRGELYWLDAPKAQPGAPSSTSTELALS